MKTEYRFIHFEEALELWRCVNSKHKNLLGTVEWYLPWKLFCFFPELNTAFSKDCLEDICDFIKQLGGKDEKRS